MGDLTLAGFRSELYQITGMRTDIQDPAFTPQVDAWINRAYKFICQPKIHRHPELVTVGTPIVLVLNQDVYAIPFVCMGIMSVRWYMTSTNPPPANTIRRKLYPTLAAGIDEVGQKTGGPPTRYAHWGNNIEVDRLPTAGEAGQILLLRGWVEPASLVAAGDKTVVRAGWDECIVLWSAWRAWKWLRNEERAEALRGDAGQLMLMLQSAFEIDSEEWDASLNMDMTTYDLPST